MNIKKATLWGMIGAIISICVTLFYMLINLNVIEWSPAISWISNIFSLVSHATLALFFYTLYKNQK